MARQPKKTTISADAIGASGLARTGGIVHDDFLAYLNGLSARRRYREMQENDPVIGALLFAISMLIRNVEWRVEAADDTPAAEEARDWVDRMLFEDMEQTWEDVIDEAVTMFTFGFAFHEMLFRKGDRGRWEIRALPGRAQETIYEWRFDDEGGLRAVVQRPIGRPHIEIPIERLIHFRTTRRKDNPEGRSILRNSVATYERKKIIEAAEGRAANRTAGLVVVRGPAQVLSGDASGEEKAVGDALNAMARDLANDRKGAVTLPSTLYSGTNERQYDVEFVSVDGQRQQDMGAIVERQDKRMAMSVLSQWLFLGMDKVGSFSLSSDQTALFATAIGAWLKAMRAEFNRKMLGTLWAVNGMDPDIQPTLEHGDIEQRNLDKLGTFLRDTAAAGLLTPDDSLENEVRAAAGLSERDPDLDRDLAPRLDGMTDPAQAGDDGGEPEPARRRVRIPAGSRRQLPDGGEAGADGD